MMLRENSSITQKKQQKIYENIIKAPIVPQNDYRTSLCFIITILKETISWWK